MDYLKSISPVNEDVRHMIGLVMPSNKSQLTGSAKSCHRSYCNKNALLLLFGFTLITSISQLYHESSLHIITVLSQELFRNTSVYQLSQDPFYISLYNHVSIPSTRSCFNRFLHQVEEHNSWFSDGQSYNNYTAYCNTGFSTEENLFRSGYKIIGTEQWYNPFCLDRNISRNRQWCFNTLNFSAYSGCGEAVRPSSREGFELGGGCCWKGWIPVLQMNISIGDAISPKTRHRTILVLNQHHGSSYFHVMFEVLPRFFYSIPILDANPELMIGISSSPIMSQMLTLFGVNESRILNLRNRRRNKWIGADLLIYPPSVHTLFGVSNEDDVPVKKTSALLRHRVIQHHFLADDESTTNRTVIVLLERAKSRHMETGDCPEERCLKNFEALKNAIMTSLPTMDIKVYGPNENLQSSIRLFSIATIVVGVHGAGLQNQMFCKPGTSIVEIGDGPDIYQKQANVFGHKYHLVFVKGLSHRARNFSLPNVNEIALLIKNAAKEDAVL